MFSALGHGYYLFGFKHTLINISLSSKIYENTRLYFIYRVIYLFIYFHFIRRVEFCLLFSANLTERACPSHTHLCAHAVVYAYTSL